MTTKSKSKKTTEFFDGTEFKFDCFARFLASKLNLIRLDNRLFILKNGKWMPAFDELDRAMIQFIPSLNASRRLEVRRYINLLIDQEIEPADARFIAFNNGLFDITANKLVTDCRQVVLNTIPWNYTPNAYNSLADHTLNELACNDQEIRLLLEEIIGYCFYRRNELGKAFVLVGNKANGKSTFLGMLQNLIGKSNVASLDLSELNDRFRTACINNKLVNVGDDIGDRFICNPAIFKKLVTGESITAENKGESPFSFKSYCKLLFSANVIPSIKDPTGAVARRLVIVPFRNTFTKDSANYDPYIKYKLQSQETMEYLIQLGLQGLHRVLKNQGFTESEYVKNELLKYQEKNDPILGFIRESKESGYSIIGKSTKEVYEHYKLWCADNEITAGTNRFVTDKILTIYNCKVIKKRCQNNIINFYCSNC